MTPLHPDVNPCMLPTHPYTRLSRPLLPRRTSDDPTHVIPSAQLSLSHNASLEETSNSTDNILRERGVFVVTLRDTPCSARNEIKKGGNKGVYVSGEASFMGDATRAPSNNRDKET